MYNPYTLEGKTILVTGASSGIGRELAIECSRLGASVHLLARDAGRLAETLSMMEEGAHVVHCCDITDESQLDKASRPFQSSMVLPIVWAYRRWCW